MKWYGKTALAAAALSGVIAVRVAAQTPPPTQTWTGVVSDAMCKGVHDGDAKTCVDKCIKGGDKYVLVVDKTVYAIDNQKFADLPKYAGAKAVVTGQMTGTDTITISKMAAPKTK